MHLDSYLQGRVSPTVVKAQWTHDHWVGISGRTVAKPQDLWTGTRLRIRIQIIKNRVQALGDAHLAAARANGNTPLPPFGWR